MSNDFIQMNNTNKQLDNLKEEFELIKACWEYEIKAEKIYNKLNHDMFLLRKDLKEAGLYKEIDNGYVKLYETTVNKVLLSLLNEKANEREYFVYADLQTDKFGKPYVLYNLTNKQRDNEKVLKK